MHYIVHAFVFLMKTALAAAGVTMTLTASGTTPEGATPLGNTEVGTPPTSIILTITRGAGQTLETFFTGFWANAS